MGFLAYLLLGLLIDSVIAAVVAKFLLMFQFLLSAAAAANLAALTTSRCSLTCGGFAKASAVAVRRKPGVPAGGQLRREAKTSNIVDNIIKPV